MPHADSPSGKKPSPAGAPLPRRSGIPALDAEPGSVHVTVEPERTRIVLSGEIAAELTGRLRDASAQAESARVPIEVDAHEVTFMDSSGVAFLARLATHSPSRVRLVGVPTTIRFLLEVTRIGDVLDVVDR